MGSGMDGKIFIKIFPGITIIIKVFIKLISKFGRYFS